MKRRLHGAGAWRKTIDARASPLTTLEEPLPRLRRPRRHRRSRQADSAQGTVPAPRSPRPGPRRQPSRHPPRRPRRESTRARSRWARCPPGVVHPWVDRKRLSQVHVSSLVQPCDGHSARSDEGTSARWSVRVMWPSGSIRATILTCVRLRPSFSSSMERTGAPLVTGTTWSGPTAGVGSTGEREPRRSNRPAAG